MSHSWVILILCCLFYSASGTVNATSVSAQGVTSANVRFNDRVTSILAHPFKPSVIIVTTSYTVWTLDVQNLDKILIAGTTGTMRGYAEGSGSSARFHNILGSAVFDQITILVADYNNYCVRSVHLITGSTQSYAGVCRSSGSTDGYRTSAKFRSPCSIVKLGVAHYISDRNNKKIRKLSDNYVSTFATLSYNPFGLSWNGENFVYSFLHGVGDSQDSVITGSSSSYGFTDGSLSSAGYYYPYNVLAVTKHTFLVADYANGRIRFADLSTQVVSTLNITGSGWSTTYSLMVLNGSVYAGTNYGKIFKFSLDEIQVFKNLKCSSDLTLSTSSCGNVVHFQPTFTEMDSVECVGCPRVQNLTAGVHHFTYKYRSDLGYDLKICDQTATVQDPSIIVCPAELNLTLPSNTDYVNLTLPKPQIASCASSTLGCVECPSSAQLVEGVHEIRFVYRNLITEKSLSCSYLINVVEEPPHLCVNTTEHIFLNASQKFSNKLMIGDGDIGVVLGTGVSRYEIRENCFHTYNVHEWSNMIRQTEFKAVYLMSCNCSSISTTSFSIIDGTLLLHTRYMKVHCPECMITQTLPDIQCLNNNLIVTWKTNVTGRQEIGDMKTSLQTSLRRLQSIYPYLDITVFNTIPMVVSPVTHETGLNLLVVIKTACVDNGFIYDSKSDTCIKAPCDC